MKQQINSYRIGVGSCTTATEIEEEVGGCQVGGRADQEGHICVISCAAFK